MVELDSTYLGVVLRYRLRLGTSFVRASAETTYKSSTFSGERCIKHELWHVYGE